MKKIIFLFIASLFCFPVWAKIQVENRGLALKSLPSDINNFIKKDYFNTCEEIGDSLDESRNSPPKISIGENAFINVDFNGDGLKDYIIDESEFFCENALTIFTGNSNGHLYFFLQTKDGKYKKNLTFWKARDEFSLQKIKEGYRYYSEYSDSYLRWDKGKRSFLYYDGAIRKFKYPSKAYIEATLQAPKLSKTPYIVLQVGSYADWNSADARRTEIILNGLSATVVKTVEGGKTWYRVISGPYKSLEAALIAQQTLQHSNIDSIVIQR